MEIAAALEGPSYEVVGIAATNANAKQQFRDKEPDVVTMDIELPGGVDGIETARELKEIKDVPIIFITKYTDDELLERAKAIQPLGYFPKRDDRPVDGNLLRVTIKMALNSPRAEQPQALAANKGHRVFICYSHVDKKFWKELKGQLAKVRRKGVPIWSDENIAPGQQWRDEIRQALDDTRVAVLLVSDAFQDSKFIENDELPTLIERAYQNGTRILYVVVSPCDVLDEIERFQPVNDPSCALLEMGRAARARVWMLVANQIDICFNGSKPA